MARIIPLAAATGLSALMAGFGAAHADGHKEVVHVDSAKADYKDLAPGTKDAVLWGDPKTGAHAVFTRFDAGIEHGLHTHTNDLRIVVVDGAYIYKPENGEEVRVSAGQYFFIPGGARHKTGSDEKEGAIFYQEADQKFDINFVDAPEATAQPTG